MKRFFQRQALLGLLAACGIGLLAFFIRWNYLEDTWYPSRDTSDAEGYIYYGTLLNGELLHRCRQLFGEMASCGVRPAQDSLMAFYYDESGLHSYLNRDISYPEFQGHTGFKDGYLRPMETLLSRWNLKAFETGLVFWLFGASLKNLVWAQVIFVSLTAVSAFGLTKNLQGWAAGLLAGMAVALYPATINAVHVIAPQWGAGFFLTAGCWLAALGFSGKKTRWLAAFCLLIFALYLYAFRPLVILLIFALFLYPQPEHKKTIRLAAVLVVILLVTFFVRRSYHDFSLQAHVGDMLKGTAELGPHGATGVFETDGWMTVVETPGEFPEIPNGLRRLATYAVNHPVKMAKLTLTEMYRLWMYPYWGTRGFKVWGLPDSDFPLGNVYHQVMVLVGVIGAARLLFYADWRRWSGLLLIGLLLYMSLTYAVFSVQSRYTLSMAALVMAAGSVGLVSLPRKMLTPAGVLLLSFFIVPTSQNTFGFLVAVRVIAAAGCMALLVYRPSLPRWQRVMAAGYVLLISVILAIGQARPPVNAYETKNEVRQIAHLPATFPDSGIPWLLIDSSQSAFSISINGQMVKTAEQPMFRWLDAAVYEKGVDIQKTWLALPLDPSLMIPQTKLEIMLIPQEKMTLGRSFLLKNGEFYGPTLSSDGTWLSIEKQEWDGETRVLQRSDLQGVSYESSEEGFPHMLIVWQPLRPLLVQNQPYDETDTLYLRRIYYYERPLFDSNDINYLQQTKTPFVIVRGDRALQLKLQSERFRFLDEDSGYAIFAVQDMAVTPADELFTRMNDLLFNSYEVPPWISHRYPSEAFLAKQPEWQAIEGAWELILEKNPESRLAQFGLAYTRLYLGEFDSAVWQEIYTDFPETIFADDGRYVSLEILRLLNLYAAEKPIRVLAPGEDYLRFFYPTWDINTTFAPTQLAEMAGYEVLVANQLEGFWAQQGQPLTQDWWQQARSAPLIPLAEQPTGCGLLPLVDETRVSYNLFIILLCE